jgi:phage antirepressor YoqD-like protein
MTRTARAKKNAQIKKQKSREKLLNLIQGMFADEYKKADGSWNIYKLAKDTKMSRNTIKKHLKEIKEYKC